VKKCFKKPAPWPRFSQKEAHLELLGAEPGPPIVCVCVFVCVCVCVCVWCHASGSWLVDGISLIRSGFKPRIIRVASSVKKMALIRVCPGASFIPLSVIPSMIHIHSSTYHWRSIILATDSVSNKPPRLYAVSPNKSQLLCMTHTHTYIYIYIYSNHILTILNKWKIFQCTTYIFLTYFGRSISAALTFLFAYFRYRLNSTKCITWYAIIYGPLLNRPRW
jgi:hypothetical protein